MRFGNGASSGGCEHLIRVRSLVRVQDGGQQPGRVLPLQQMSSGSSPLTHSEGNSS